MHPQAAQTANHKEGTLIPDRNYESLIYELFGAYRECVPERKFCELLPRMLHELHKKNQPFKWTGDDLAGLVMHRYGLCGTEPKTLKAVGALYGISGSAADVLLRRAMRLLKRPMEVARILQFPDAQETKAAEKDRKERWADALSGDLRHTLRTTREDGLDEEYLRGIFSLPYNREGMHFDFTFKGYCYIREALGLPPVTQSGKPKPQRPASKAEITQAINLLTRLGYQVEGPD